MKNYAFYPAKMRNFLIMIIGLLLLTYHRADTARYPGICLSFDDRSVDAWFQLREIFIHNNVRATFFITQPDSLSKTAINKLKILEKDGHEIGFHGNMHVLSEYYIQEHSYADYLEKEIDKGMDKMHFLGFECVSFAYPYGAKYWFTDFLLLDKFEFLRGVSKLNKEKNLSQMDEIYYSFDNDRTLSAMGIDNIAGINESMIDQAIERVINKQEILLIYAHTPTNDKEATGYSFNIDFLKYIIQKAGENNIGFYPMRELSRKYNSM